MVVIHVVILAAKGHLDVLHCVLGTCYSYNINGIIHHHIGYCGHIAIWAVTQCFCKVLFYLLHPLLLGIKPSPHVLHQIYNVI